MGPTRLCGSTSLSSLLKAQKWVFRHNKTPCYSDVILNPSQISLGMNSFLFTSLQSKIPRMKLKAWREILVGCPKQLNPLIHFVLFSNFIKQVLIHGCWWWTSFIILIQFRLVFLTWSLGHLCSHEDKSINTHRCKCCRTRWQDKKAPVFQHLAQNLGC